MVGDTKQRKVDTERCAGNEKKRYSGGWKEIQWWMEGDTEVGGRRYSGGWKKTQNRMMKGDTVVDGRRHKIG